MLDNLRLSEKALNEKLLTRGVTKREYYAAAAMPAIINRLGVTTTEAEVDARMAFQMADAMIKESGK